MVRNPLKHTSSYMCFWNGERRGEKGEETVRNPEFIHRIEQKGRSNCCENVHTSADKASNAKCPSQRNIANCSSHHEGEYKSTNARPCGTDAVGQAATMTEPLREDCYARDVGEAAAQANQHALGEVKMPDTGCK
jgi:hypothetical protein